MSNLNELFPSLREMYMSEDSENESLAVSIVKKAPHNVGDNAKIKRIFRVIEVMKVLRGTDANGVVMQLMYNNGGGYSENADNDWYIYKDIGLDPSKNTKTFTVYTVKNIFESNTVIWKNIFQVKNMLDLQYTFNMAKIPEKDIQPFIDDFFVITKKTITMKYQMSFKEQAFSLSK